jgi:hypothetical protein
MEPKPEKIYCSFCSRNQDEVALLIRSPGDNPLSAICDGCVISCIQAICERLRLFQEGLATKE